MVRSTSILIRGMFTIVLISFMSLFFIEAVNADSYYAASTFSFSGSFDSWAKCGKTGYGSNTAGNYMYKSIVQDISGSHNIYVYADMDNNLCSSCDFYVDGTLVWPSVSLYAASSSCEARLLGNIPLGSGAHEFRFDRSTDAGGWVELIDLITARTSADTCGAGQYAYGGSCTNVGTGYYSAANYNDRTACPSNSVSSGSGTGADALDDCLGNAGYYNCQSGTCSVAGAGYYSPTSDNSRYSCSAGYYGTSTTNSASTCNGACTAGYYCTAGSTSATQNACGTGKYCPAGSSGTTNCAAGYYGSSTTNSVSTCNGACTAGYYCTAGSTRATQNACGTGKYCPAGSSGTTNCAAGYYGSSTTNSVSTCNGACTAGYYCTAGSTSATQNACGTGNYCPAAS